MIRLPQSLVIGLIVVGAAPAALADLGELRDGLHTWQIEGTSGVWSCCRATSGATQVVVRITDGIPERIWLTSSACPDSTDGPVEDHGIESAANNVAWLRSVIENRRVDQEVREEALFALVQTESEEAFEYLDRLLTDR